MTNKTVCIHVNEMQDGDVYIGRAVPRRGLAASKFANPFKVGKDCTREQVIEQYRQWLLRYPDSPRADIHELKGKRLACWCAPKPCHGDVLVELAEAS